MDCCQFAFSLIEAMTGMNPGTGFVYSGRVQAMNLIRSFGSFSEMLSTLAERSGLQRIEPGKAQRGDLVEVAHQGKRVAGIVSLRGDKAIVKLKGIGLGLVPIKQAVSAWRV